MALQLERTVSSGRSASYWKILEINRNILSGIISTKLGGWESLQIRQQYPEMKPIGYASFFWTGDDRPTSRAEIYSAIKQKPEWTTAEDV